MKKRDGFCDQVATREESLRMRKSVEWVPNLQSEIGRRIGGLVAKGLAHRVEVDGKVRYTS